MIVGKQLRVTAPDGRCEEIARRLDGRVLERIEPVGKHLFYHFGGVEPRFVHVHLALLGKFRYFKDEIPEPRGAVRVRFDAGEAAVDVHGARATELLDDEATSSIKDRLGPDPLNADADVEKAWRRISKSSAPIGGLLMDQAVVSGIGNIYRAEVLFRQRIHPLLPGKHLSREQFDGIWADSVELLKLGVKYDRIITISREFAKERFGKTYAKLARRERWYVYKHETCPLTGGPVEAFDLNGRTVYFSPQHQPWPKALPKPAERKRALKKPRRKKAATKP